MARRNDLTAAASNFKPFDRCEGGKCKSAFARGTAFTSTERIARDWDTVLESYRIAAQIRREREARAWAAEKREILRDRG